MDFRKDESGNVLIVTAMCSTILLGMAGMALDVGLAYRTRQRVQTAADAGAIAAAVSYLNGGNGTTAADAATQANGYQNGTTIGGQAISVTVTPVTFNGDSGYAQVVVNAPNPTNFMRVFGFNSLGVTGTAVAGPALVGGGCMFFPKSTGNDIVYLQGAGTIHANCGGYVNSDGSKAVDIHDCGVVNAKGLTYKFLDVVGGAKLPNGCSSSINVTTGAPYNGSPWGDSLTGPNPTSVCSGSGDSGTGNIYSHASYAASSAFNASSGYVCFSNAVTLSGNGTLPGSTAGVVYIFENGLTLSGSNLSFGTGSCSGTGTSTTCTTSAGAMIDLAGGTLTPRITT